jgi:LysM repeat protein
MKRISLLLATLSLCAMPSLHAQDAATEERINKLAGSIADLSDRQTTANAALGQQIQILSKRIENVSAEMSKPQPSYATQEDLKRLAEAVKEIDRKRMDDMERFRTEVRTELKNLAAILAKAPAPPVIRSAKPKPAPEVETPAPKVSEDGYEYVVQKGDTLALVTQLYREKGIKVTQKQILDANPKVKNGKLLIGQKLFIPAPAGAGKEAKASKE